MRNRIKRLREVLIAINMVLLTATAPLSAGQTEAEAPATGSAWKFDVYLDDRKIGYHHFFMAEAGETRQLRSVASFEYSLMFVPLFRYEHENREIWQGECLHSIDSQTDSNGEAFRVNGRRTAGEFQLSTQGGDASLPECVMSFAYWNPAFLEQPTLLNTQNGAFMPVTVSGPVPEQLDIQGELIATNRYGLEAGDLRLDLWYSENREWVALESEVRGGRTLRYVLNGDTVLKASAERNRPMLTRRDTGVDAHRQGS
jgi:Domain of unknown function (DUF6134)